ALISSPKIPVRPKSTAALCMAIKACCRVMGQVTDTRKSAGRRHYTSRFPLYLSNMEADLSKQAKAIRIESHGGPEVLTLTTVEVAEPGKGEVMIRQKAAGLNFIDIYFRTGLYPHALPHGLGFEA